MKIHWTSNIKSFIDNTYDSTNNMIKLFNTKTNICNDIINIDFSNKNRIKPIVLVNYNKLNDIYVTSLKDKLYNFFVIYGHDADKVQLVSNLNIHYPQNSSAIVFTNKSNLYELVSKEVYNEYYSDIKYLITFSNIVDLDLYNVFNFKSVIHVARDLSGDNMFIEKDCSNNIILGFKIISLQPEDSHKIYINY